MSAHGVEPSAEEALRDRFARRRHDAYARFFSPVTDRFLPELVQRVDGPPGPAADLGAGQGRLAAELIRRDWRVVSVDRDPMMVQDASRVGPAVLADAERLPFRGGTFGAVVAAFLLPHVEDLDRHLREVVRVLRPGGVMTQLGWADPLTSPFTGLATTVLDQYAAPDVRDLLSAARRRTDGRFLGDTARSAGLVDVRVEVVRHTVDLPDAGSWWRGMLVASTGLSILLQRTPPDVRRRVEEEFMTRARRFTVEDGLAVPVAALVLTGARGPGATA